MSKFPITSFKPSSFVKPEPKQTPHEEEPPVLDDPWWQFTDEDKMNVASGEDAYV